MSFSNDENLIFIPFNEILEDFLDKKAIIELYGVDFTGRMMESGAKLEIKDQDAVVADLNSILHEHVGERTKLIIGCILEGDCIQDQSIEYLIKITDKVSFRDRTFAFE